MYNLSTINFRSMVQEAKQPKQRIECCKKIIMMNSRLGHIYYLLALFIAKCQVKFSVIQSTPI